MNAAWIGDARTRARAGRERLALYLVRRPWVARAAATAVLIAAGLVALVLFLLVLIIALPVFVVALAASSIRGRIGRARGPNGVLDGRRGVRVIVRETSA